MSFQRTSSHSLAALDIEYQHYLHPCGLEHIHLQRDDPHQSCLIALRTHPSDNTGVAHALEHLVLCGSEAYPVRDPFFMMLRRSMQTFMNAMTGSDMTWYPFASANNADFCNIFQVYSDAVFRPLLHPLDFAQEGHRLECCDDGRWTRNGIVYNEMKGAMSDSSSILYQAYCAALMPNTPYQWNSGGDPSAIAELSHQAVVDFHKKFYTPANACVVSYGNCDIPWMQQQLEKYCTYSTYGTAPQENASTSQPNQPIIPPVQQRPASSSISVTIPRQTEGPDDAHAQECEHLIYACIWDDTANAEENILGDFCEELLFAHAASPMQLALESSGLCHSISESGYCDAHRSGLFTIEAHGCTAENLNRIEKLIKKTLHDIISQGFSEQELQAALHQTELDLLYIGGDSTPFGLELCEQSACAWNMGSDPLSHLDQHRALTNIRHKIIDSDFWTELIQQRLLDNPHQVTLRSQADEHYFDTLAQLEQDTLDAEIAQLSTAEKKNILQQQKDLDIRQHNEDDQNILPQIHLSDIDDKRIWPKVCTHSLNSTGHNIYSVPAPCNGIAHYSLLISVQSLTHTQDLSALACISYLIGHCGTKTHSYLHIAQDIQAYAGSLHTELQAWNCQQYPASSIYAIDMEMWGLQKNISQWHTFTTEYLSTIVFSECQRIRELLEELIQEKEEALIHSGHSYALYAASASFAGIVGGLHHSHGIAYIHYLRKLLTLSDQELSNVLNNDYHTYIGPVAQTSLIGSFHNTDIATLQQTLNVETNGAQLDTQSSTQLTTQLATNPIKKYQAQTIASKVNYIAMTQSLPTLDHADAAALVIAATCLENKYLHTRIREQGGAYGASAHYNRSYNRLSLTSYRDPRLDDSIYDMFACVQDLTEKPLQHSDLEQAIISTIASIDRPQSPASEGKRAVFMQHSGWDQNYINAYRQAILHVQVPDMQRVWKQYINPEHFNIAVLGNAQSIQKSQYTWSAIL